jgi:hypothetical protein
MSIPTAQADQITPLEHNLSAGRFQEAEQHQADRGLARPGLADDSQRLAGQDVETDIIYRRLVRFRGKNALAQGKLLDQILDRNQRFGTGVFVAH